MYTAMFQFCTEAEGSTGIGGVIIDSSSELESVSSSLSSSSSSRSSLTVAVEVEVGCSSSTVSVKETLLNQNSSRRC